MRVVRADQTIDAVPGTTVFATDRVVSGPNSTAGIVFKDGTLVTVGAGSDLQIRDYAFETKDSKYQFSMYLAKGSAIYSSGKIGKLSRRNRSGSTRRRRRSACAARVSSSRPNSRLDDESLAAPSSSFSPASASSQSFAIGGCATPPPVKQPDDHGDPDARRGRPRRRGHGQLGRRYDPDRRGVRGIDRDRRPGRAVADRRARPRRGRERLPEPDRRAAAEADQLHPLLPSRSHDADRRVQGDDPGRDRRGSRAQADRDQHLRPHRRDRHRAAQHEAVRRAREASSPTC